MALVKCKDCGHGHSKKAKNCPKCGKPNAAQQARKRSMILLIIVIAIIVGGLKYMSNQASGKADKLQKQRENWLKSF
jgi:uncharacterized protein (DUF983 family)